MEVFILTNDVTITRFPQNNNVDLLQYFDFAGTELELRYRYRYFHYSDMPISDIRTYYKKGIVRRAHHGIEFVALAPQYHLDMFPPRVRVRPAYFVIEFSPFFPKMSEIAVKRTKENALHHVVMLIRDVVYGFG